MRVRPLEPQRRLDALLDPPVPTEGKSDRPLGIGACGEAGTDGRPAEAWPRIYVKFLGRYKLAILLFNLAPWPALKIVG